MKRERFEGRLVFNSTALQKRDQIMIKIPFNILFLGFSDFGFTETSELEEWFAHVDHTIDHQTIPLFETILSTKDMLQTSTFITYQIMINAIKVSDQVIKVIENQINNFKRYEDASSEEPESMLYVNVERVNRPLDHMLDYLGLSEQYSLIIMNPQKKDPASKYGYRIGFSQQEIDTLISVISLEKKSHSRANSFFSSILSKTDFSKDKYGITSFNSRDEHRRKQQ